LPILCYNNINNKYYLTMLFMFSIKRIALLIVLAILFSPLSAFADDPSTPEITSFSPTTITPGDTLLTISGTGFGEPFNSPENEICFDASNCYDATDLNDYLQSWTDTEVQTIVPDDISGSSFKILLKVYMSDTATFDFIESPDYYTVLLPPEPLITSFSPMEVTPGETVVTILGITFGDNFNPLGNSVCFGVENCVDESDISSWTDTEVQALVPATTAIDEYIYMNVYSYLYDEYKNVESSDQFTIADVGGDETSITLSPIYSGSIFDEDEDGNGDNLGLDYYEGGQPTVGIGEYSSWATYNAKANAEYNISSLSGKTITSATLTADAWYANTDPLTVSWYYYEGDGIRSLSDYHQSATFITSVNSSGETYVLSVDVTDKLQALADASSSYIGFRGERSSGTGTIGWYEPIELEVSYLDDGGDDDDGDDDDDDTGPEITSFSPTVITPGESTIEINGTDLGNSYVEGSSQICFGNDCISDDDIDTYLQSWATNRVRVTAPETFTGPAKIRLKVYSSAEGSYEFIESSSNYRLMPKITSFSPSSFNPGETVVTISGYEFGSAYLDGLNQICFGEDCIADESIDDYLQSWASTEVQVLVPEFVEGSGHIGLVVNIPTSEMYALFSSASTYSINIPADPEITLIAPDVLVAGETVVTISGSGFGDSYSPGYNQICFVDNCIIDESIDSYLVSWSDTEIVLTTPPFVTHESGTIDLKLYLPSTGFYEFVSSPPYTTLQKPVIEWYYEQMEQGLTYDFSGQNFGDSAGKVVINGVECEIVSWSDTDVEFTVPSNATSGNVYIESAEGVKSQELYVDIIQVVRYSDDEYSNYQWHFEKINMVDAWNITEGSSDVVVAVIDSGVDINHEDLQHAIWENEDEIANNGIDDDGNGYIDDVNGWDFVLNSNSTAPRGAHGTMVSSMIAAKKDNTVGIAGVAPNVTIMPLNIALYDEVSIDVDAALYSIKYAVDNGADIINMSFGGLGAEEAYADVIQYAYDNNVLVVAATGNENSDLVDYPDYMPVCSDLGVNAILGIAATDSNNIRSYFSNYGSACTDLAAPGEYLPLALPSSYGYYELADGTSFSSPLVAGIAALIKSEHSDWNVEEIKYVLLDTAVNIDYLNSYYAGKLGEGVPDAYAALRASRPDVSYTYNPTTDLDIDETNETIDIDIPDSEPIIEPEPVYDETIDEDVVEKDTTVISSSPFTDTANHEYEDSINYLYDIGVIHGHPDGSFKPDYEINRAEFTKIVMGAFYGENFTGTYCFPDVNDEWFAPYVCEAYYYGIIHGHPDGTFKPDHNINLVEALKIVLEAQGVYFTVEPGDEWYEPYIIYAMASDLDFILYKRGFGDSITRGEMAELVTLSLP
jgi:hypothetical protein